MRNTDVAERYDPSVSGICKTARIYFSVGFPFGTALRDQLEVAPVAQKHDPCPQLCVYVGYSLAMPHART